MARTAGSALLLLLLLPACGGGGGGASIDARVDEFDRAAMNANLVAGVIRPTYQSFADRAGELKTAAAVWCGDPGALEMARAAWRAAMVEWQLAEVMLVGPAAMDDRALRDLIYSWPTVSTCAVDQEVAMVHTDPDGYDIATRTANRRGLAALEYVLFTDSLDHTCPSQLEPPGWNDLAEEERRAARCAYARAAADDVAARAGEVVQGWEAYAADLAAGSPQEAANLVSDGMFYLDTDTKDMKLAEPAGILSSTLCSLGDPCPPELESPHARFGRENVAANLEGFRMLMSGNREEGGDGIGFEDFLRGLGGGELADEMMGDLAAAAAASEALPIPLEEAIVEEPAAVAAAHAAVKAVTDNLKSRFLTILGLDAPDNAAGDND
jgi:hypothetical protein